MTAITNAQYDITDVCRGYLNFLSSDVRNAWVGGQHIEVYLRKADRPFRLERMHTDSVRTLQITNIQLLHNAPTGHRIFSRVLNFIEANLSHDAIMVESVMTEQFEKYFVRHGYDKIKVSAFDGLSHLDPPSYVKMFRKELIHHDW